MSFAAVLFDLDGTLLDTLEDLADSTNRVLEAGGFPPHPVDAYRYLVGEGMEALMRRALPEGAREPETVAGCLTGLREEYGRRWKVKTRPYPGIPELLAELNRRRVLLTVLSNKPDEFTRAMVEELLSDYCFARVRGALPGAPKKPDPTAALEMAAWLGLEPARWLYLGDTAIDMQTAVRAGMYPLGATWGFRPAQELLSSGARRLLDRPEELLDLL